MKAFLTRYSLYLSWLIACIATLASLYFSEVRHLEPCKVCWYQRIAMYPLVIQLGIACWRGSYAFISYIMPLIIIGFLLSIYHLVIQYFPGLLSLDLCNDGANNCGKDGNIGLGFLSLPLLSALAFLIMGFLLSYGAKRKKHA